MKKLMSLTLGLALLTGAATVAFSQTDTDKKKATKKKKKKSASQHIKGEAPSAAKKGTDTDKKAQ